MAPGNEKRSAPRVSYACEVECTGLGVSAINPRIADLSMTGAFIDTMTVLPAGSVVDLAFRLGDRLLNVKAEVKNPMAHVGMGVQFVDLSEEQAAILADFVSGRS